MSQENSQERKSLNEQDKLVRVTTPLANSGKSVMSNNAFSLNLPEQVCQQKIMQFIERLDRDLLNFTYNNTQILRQKYPIDRGCMFSNAQAVFIKRGINLQAFYKTIRAYDYYLQLYTIRPQQSVGLSNEQFQYTMILLIADIIDKIMNFKLFFPNVVTSFKANPQALLSVQFDLIAKLQSFISYYFATDMIDMFINTDFFNDFSGSQINDFTMYQSQQAEDLMEVAGSPIQNAQQSQREQKQQLINQCVRDCINVVIKNPEFTDKEIFYAVLLKNADDKTYGKQLQMMYKLQQDDSHFSKNNVQHILTILQSEEN